MNKEILNVTNTDEAKKAAPPGKNALRRSLMAAAVVLPLNACADIFYDLTGTPTETVKIKCVADIDRVPVAKPDGSIERKLVRDEKGREQWEIVYETARENCTSTIEIEGRVPTKMPEHKDWPK